MIRDVETVNIARSLVVGGLVFLLWAPASGCELITGADNEPPTVNIESPAAGASFPEGEEITFRGSGTDPEDGDLTGSALVWTSDRDGRLGTGTTVTASDLTVGTHEITLTGEDAEGATGTASVTMTLEPNRPPSATIEEPADGARVADGQSVTFRGAGSDPEDGDLTGDALHWSSDLDGTLGSGETVTRSDLSVGTHDVTLEATDSQGVTGTASISITVEENEAPSATIEEPADGASFTQGESVTLEGSASDPEDGTLTGDALQWASDLDGDLGSGSTVTRSDLSVGSHELTLEATDSQGATGAATITISVEEANDAPAADIESPSDEHVSVTGETVTFQGSGQDPEDGSLAGSSLIWRSDRDGTLGTGGTIEVSSLSAGPHRVTLTVEDSDGATDTDAIEILVESPGYDIRVRFLATVSSSQESIIRDAIEEWEETITGDLSPIFPGRGGACAEAGRGVDDLLVSIDVVSIDGSGGVLARAGPCLLRSTDDLPIAGVMEIDEADIDAMESGGTLDDLVLHEVGHILGIGISAVGDWGVHLEDLSTLDPFFTGPEAVREFGDIGGEAYLSDPVPLANTGGQGTRSAHWREVNFENELMTGFLNSGSNPMSRVTIGSLADIGYSVNLSQADAFSLPMPQLALWEPVADATLARPTESSSNFGSSGDGDLGRNIVVGANGEEWVAGHPSDELYTGLIRFGVPSLPSGVSIESAELELHESGTGAGSGSETIDLLQVTGGWSEGSVTWDDRPGFGSTLHSYGRTSCNDDCFLSSSALLSLVRDWADGSAANNGLALDAPDAGSDNLYSDGYTARHSSDEGSRPRMRVEASTGGAARTAGARPAGGAGADGRIPLGQDLLLDIPLYVQTPDGRVLRIR